jgi:hypothetical protein
MVLQPWQSGQPALWWCSYVLMESQTCVPTHLLRELFCLLPDAAGWLHPCTAEVHLQQRSKIETQQQQDTMLAA